VYNYVAKHFCYIEPNSLHFIEAVCIILLLNISVILNQIGYSLLKLYVSHIDYNRDDTEAFTLLVVIGN
jgi:hypothetical protein